MEPHLSSESLGLLLTDGQPLARLLAYVGPGAGLSAIGALLAVIGGVVLAVFGFVWYPVKRLLRGRRKPGPASQPDPGE